MSRSFHGTSYKQRLAKLPDTEKVIRHEKGCPLSTQPEYTVTISTIENSEVEWRTIAQYSFPSFFSEYSGHRFEPGVVSFITKWAMERNLYWLTFEQVIAAVREFAKEEAEKNRRMVKASKNDRYIWNVAEESIRGMKVRHVNRLCSVPVLKETTQIIGHDTCTCDWIFPIPSARHKVSGGCSCDWCTRRFDAERAKTRDELRNEARIFNTEGEKCISLNLPEE